MTSIILGVFIESISSFDYLWTIFTFLTLVLILLPPLKFRNKKVMLPWEVIVIAAIPMIVRTLEISILANEIATYISLSALALIIAVETHVFTSVKFNHTFAVAFTVISTLALTGIWAIIRYNMDLYLGTSFLTTNEELMHEFINVLIAGVAAGVVFDTYFRKRDRSLKNKLMEEELG